ncbi:MAG: plastocyanin/azurin family copper-binding protein [Nitrososphaeria archaeon]
MKSLVLTVVVIGAVLLSVVFASPLIFYHNLTSYSGSSQTYGPGTMPYNSGSMMTYYGQTVSVQSAMMEVTANPPPYVTLMPLNDTAIINSSSNIHITAYAMMGSMAVNVTGHPLPAYSSGDVFVIYGLINPTLVFASDTPSVKLTITVVNLDNDMYHNFVITSTPPPYKYMAASSTMVSFSGNLMYMMPYLPPTSNGEAFVYTYSVQLQGHGQLWYLCTYPGHAESGMYGEIIAG